MRRKTLRTVLYAGCALLWVFIILAVVTKSDVFTYIGCAVAVALVAVLAISGRCPYCKTFIRKASVKVCPHCGKEIW